MESPINQIKCEIIIVSDSGVRKTSIMNMFCEETYTRYYATVDKTLHVILYGRNG